ncbi:MAG: hypothetical protein WCA32_07020 [Chromatiaceae bacterium]
MYATHADATPAAASPLILTGPCGYAIQNGRIVITIGEIANHRNLGDLSRSKAFGAEKRATRSRLLSVCT